MTSKLKCPFCGGELKHEKTTGIYCCPTIFIDCPLGSGTGAFGTKELWQALIQAKQDLKIARKALKDMMESGGDGYHIARKALEQIEHKDEK